MTRKLFDDTKTTRQGRIYTKYSITNHEANRRGRARWDELNSAGAWDRQNYIDNFGEEDESSSTS